MSQSQHSKETDGERGLCKFNQSFGLSQPRDPASPASRVHVPLDSFQLPNDLFSLQRLDIPLALSRTFLVFRDDAVHITIHGYNRKEREYSSTNPAEPMPPAKSKFLTEDSRSEGSTVRERQIAAAAHARKSKNGRVGAEQWELVEGPCPRER